MSNLSAHCRECFYEKTHTENDHPCSNCYGGDECLDKRIPELQAQVAKMRKALEEIHRTAMYDNGSAPAPFCFVLAFNAIKEKAREALKDLPPT